MATNAIPARPWSRLFCGRSAMLLHRDGQRNAPDQRRIRSRVHHVELELRYFLAVVARTLRFRELHLLEERRLLELAVEARECLDVDRISDQPDADCVLRDDDAERLPLLAPTR